MPEYAGFADLAAYLRNRCRREGWSYHEASDKLGAGNSYVRDAIAGRMRPSPERCGSIARLFNDSPRLVRILAGHDLPPEASDAALDALMEIATRLSSAGRDDLLRYARSLSDSASGQGPAANSGERS